MNLSILASLTFTILLLSAIAPSIQLSTAQEPVCFPYIYLPSDWSYVYNPGNRGDRHWTNPSNIVVFLDPNDQNVRLIITTIPFRYQGEFNPYNLPQVYHNPFNHPQGYPYPRQTFQIISEVGLEQEYYVGSDTSLQAYQRIYNKTSEERIPTAHTRIPGTITTNKTVIETFTVNYPYDNAGLIFTFQTDPSIFKSYFDDVLEPPEAPLEAYAQLLDSFAVNNGECDNF